LGVSPIKGAPDKEYQRFFTFGFTVSPRGYCLPSDTVPAGEADDAIPGFAVTRALPDTSGLGTSLPGLNCLARAFLL
jgi:hypothetical protein